MGGIYPEPVRCPICGRLLMYKLSETHGLLQCKCSKCGRILEIDLSESYPEPKKKS